MNRRQYYRLLVVAAVLGVLVGLFATVFRLTWNAADHFLWSTLDERYWRVVVSTVAGVLIGGIIYATFYPGTLSTLVRQFHLDGAVPADDNIPVIPSGLVGLVAGQSAGPEGVMSVVGGSAGTKIASLLGVEDATRLLTLAGMGAGFGSILGAPIGGALLWLELPHDRGIEYYEAIIPTLVASFAGYLTMVSIGGLSLFPIWKASPTFPLTTTHLLVAIGVGLLCIPFALLYTQVFGLVGALFNRYSPRPFVRTTVAGLGIGLLGFYLPLTYFYGGKQINEVLAGEFTLAALLALVVGEMLAAALTINGNWQGGLIIPHMFMGAAIGRAAALVVPGVDPVLAMLGGMAAFNSTVTGTPLSSALIAIALTDGASVVPVFLASLCAFVASPVVRFVETTASRTEPAGFYLGESDD
ncbi:chloride channel protein [Halomarina pelagica]|uniref:chloride channel protein n=1 Tax=Halomarina pelagica TaxID=2961599 RepID=UPI0020C31053|nr:chloride channel protein [Halomarina sp. BND7]